MFQMFERLIKTVIRFVQQYVARRLIYAAIAVSYGAYALGVGTGVISWVLVILYLSLAVRR